MSETLQDLQVQATNDDAASSKCSAVQLGYWQDPYIASFVKASPRRTPEMNRGYYARVKAIDSLFKQFLDSTEGKCQVVNLGAGFDTSFWNLSGTMPLAWVDMDFDTIINRKIKAINSKKNLQEGLKLLTGDLEVTSSRIRGELHTAIYHCVPYDLRNLGDLESTLKVKCGLNFELPTLFITECVLVYMEGGHSSALVTWVAQKFPCAMFVNYEQIGMEDTFGEVMKRNLHSRGLGLVGVEHCGSLQSQLDRFLKNGWEEADGADLMQIYKGMPTQELARIERIEMLDEMEMFEMLLRHYCVVWATVGGGSLKSIKLNVKK